MKFNVYIIDDTPGKTARLPDFLKWLKKSFPHAAFAKGFTEPNAASSNTDQILRALRDPCGVILLDALMDSDKHIMIAEQIQRGENVRASDFKRVWKELGSKHGTKLTAAIECA